MSATTPMAALKEPAKRSDIDVVREALEADYEVHEELGRGGMAVVYRGTERGLDRDVALKVLPFSMAHDTDFVERFEREAKTAAKLEHSNIIPVYRVGRSGMVIYFAMRLIRGPSLQARLQAEGPLPPAELRQLLIEGSLALGYAHKHGIVHRDIKPDNILFKTDGHPVLCDFGIAKAASSVDLTGTGLAIGTPYYMSPEQVRAQPLDGRSDLYSLGVVGYQCLTGSFPFDGEDSYTIGYKHIHEPVPTPSDLPTGEHRHLFAVIRRMLAKDPDFRYQHADELIAALKSGSDPAAETMLVTTTVETPAQQETAPAGVPAITLDAPATPSTPMPTRPTDFGKRIAVGRPKKKRSKIPVVMGALFVMLGGVGGGYYYVEVMGKPLTFLERLNIPLGPLAGLAGLNTVADSSETPEPEPVSPPQTLDSASRDSAMADPVDGDGAASMMPSRKGTLVVTGDLAGNPFITVDSVPYERRNIVLDPGPHTLSVIRSGDAPFERLVTVTAGAIDTVVVDWTPTPEVHAEPPREQPALVRPNQPVEPATPQPVGQCERYDEETYNLNRICYDRPPQSTGSLPLVQPPADAQWPLAVSADVAVQVNSNGGVMEVVLLRSSGIQEFDAIAKGMAGAFVYLPARKDGRSVSAWVKVTFTKG